MRLLIVLIVLLLCCLLSLDESIINIVQRGGAASADKGPTGLHGWHRDGKCNYQLLKVVKTFLKANKLNQNTSENWGLYLPCGYNHAEKEYDNIKSTSADQKIFIIKGGDNLSRKDTLWKKLDERYGEAASQYMPKTYLLGQHTDLQKLSKEYSSDKVYILKKNIQRQEGLKMTKNKQELLEGKSHGYVVAQEMLQDPYLIDGRKTNCRFYLLVMCRGGKKAGYLYNDGFMYYTPSAFRTGSMEKDQVITAGLSTARRDAKFYKTHPLTLQDFQKTLRRSQNPKERGVDIFREVGVLLNKVLQASSPSFCTDSTLKDRTTFQLFGCDIAFNNMLKPQLIEINKGPDMSSRSQKEVQVKDGLMEHIFQEVGVVPRKDTPGKLLKIWESA